jgi:hypothetical protein
MGNFEVGGQEEGPETRLAPAGTVFKLMSKGFQVARNDNNALQWVRMAEMVRYMQMR